MAADTVPGQDQFRRAGPFMLSANKDTAIAGLKVTKGLEVRPWRTTVNLGAFVDVRQKTVSGFSRVEVDAGKCGTVVADIEGVELQKEWTLSLGAAESQLSVAAGVGITTGRPYINVDIRPSRRSVKAAMMAWTLSKGEGVDVRPSITLGRNASIEIPVTLTAERTKATNAESGVVEETFDHLKLHAHGAIACLKFPNHVVKGERGREGGEAESAGSEGAAKKDAVDVKPAAPDPTARRQTQRSEVKGQGGFLGKVEKQKATKTKAELEAEAKKAKHGVKNTKAEIDAESKKTARGWGLK